MGGVCGYLTHICGQAARAAAGAWCWWRGAWAATQRQGRRSAGQRRGVLCSVMCVRHCVCVPCSECRPLGAAGGAWVQGGAAAAAAATAVRLCRM